MGVLAAGTEKTDHWRGFAERQLLQVLKVRSVVLLWEKIKHGSFIFPEPALTTFQWTDPKLGSKVWTLGLLVGRGAWRTKCISHSPWLSMCFTPIHSLRKELDEQDLRRKLLHLAASSVTARTLHNSHASLGMWQRQGLSAYVFLDSVLSLFHIPHHLTRIFSGLLSFFPSLPHLVLSMSSIFSLWHRDRERETRLDS